MTILYAALQRLLIGICAVVTNDKCITCMQTVWTQIKLLPMEQSDLGPHCLLQRLTMTKQQ